MNDRKMWALLDEIAKSQKAALKKLQDKNKVRLEQRKSEKKEEAAKPTCADCSGIDGCVASTPSWSSPCLSFQVKRKSQTDGCDDCKHCYDDKDDSVADLIYCGYLKKYMGKSVACLCFTEASKEEVVKPTCGDCANHCVNQDEGRDPVARSGITLCLERRIHVPLISPACDWFVQASKGETEPEPNETLQEKTKTIAETISDLYHQIANLDSQKDCLKAANEELKDLVLNCPACDSHVQEIDALIDENNKLCDTFLEQDVIIANLKRRLQAEVKENEILANSLRSAELTLGASEATVDELTKRNDRLKQACSKGDVITNDLCDQLHRAEKELEQLRAYKHSASNDEKVREAIIFEQQKELKRSKQIYLFMYAAQFSVDIADLTSRQRADAETLYELGLQRKMN